MNKFLVFFTLGIVSIISINDVFSQINEVIITPTPGSGAPGCEETTNGCFIPNIVIVELGEKVIFSNIENAAHTFTAGTVLNGSSGVFDSGIVTSGSSYEWIPTTAGEFPYYCMLHPWMVGTITVKEENQPQMPVTISVKTDKPEYHQGETIIISGSVSNVTGAIVGLTVRAPDNDIVKILQIVVNQDKKFSNSLFVDNILTTEGIYNISVVYESQSNSTQFIITDLIQPGFPDVDSDGFNSNQDCNDTDPKIHPNAIETINDGIDQDCKDGDASFLDNDKIYHLQLDSGSFSLPEGFQIEQIIKSKTKGEADNIFFLQADDYLDFDERKKLEDDGIILIDILNGFVYVASANDTSIIHFNNNENSYPKIRSMIPIEPYTKRDFKVEKNIIPPWVYSEKDNEDTKYVYTIYFHKQISAKKMMEILLPYHAEIGYTYEGINAVSALMSFNEMKNLSKHSAVKFITFPDSPIVPESSRERKEYSITQIDNIDPSLKGKDVVVWIFDDAPVNQHDDFGERLIQTNPSPNFGEWGNIHATRVAGILGGDGTLDYNMQGIAPEVKILTWGSEDKPVGLDRKWNESPGDLEFGLSNATKKLEDDNIGDRIDLMNISLGQPVNDNHLECSEHGKYSTTAKMLDTFVHGYTKNGVSFKPIIITKSAGNDRLAIDCVNKTGKEPFDTLPSPATAKNPIVVGSIDANTKEISSFSSYGPTDDGRIKPDLVAPGALFSKGVPDNGILGYKSTTLNNLYDECWGTSCAAPFVGGLIALMEEKWEKKNDNSSEPRLLSHTAKAILIHSAEDLGEIGPDYKYGWGMINAKNAIKLISDSKFINTSGSNNQKLNNPHTIITDSFNSQNNSQKKYKLMLDSLSNLTLTLVWDDFPETPGEPTKVLINDLDLKIINGDITFRPSVLDKENPNIPAKIGSDDDINNVEMIKTIQPKGEVDIIVSTEQFLHSPQDFTLIVSVEPPHVFEIKLEPIPPVEVNQGESVNFYAKLEPPLEGVSYRLENEPDGALIRNQTGQFMWEPSEDQIRAEPYTFHILAIKNGKELDKKTISIKVGGCFIATATFGSPLAPEVKKLREIKDNQLLTTKSGNNIMTLFNTYYYTFSPTIADYEEENPTFKELVKIGITPMLYSFSILSLADSEISVVVLAIVVILINAGMYLALPIFTVVRIRKHFKNK